MSSSPSDSRPDRPSRDVVDTAFAEIKSGPSRMDQFMDRHHKSLLVLVIALVLGGAAWLVWRWNDARGSRLAAEEFSEAADVPELLAIADKHRGTPAAGTALLEAAQRTLREGKAEAALPLLQRFIDESPRHPLHAEGLVALASLQQELGQDAGATWARLDPLIEKQPSLELVRALHIGDQLFADGKAAEAISTWRSAIDSGADAAAHWRQSIEQRLELASGSEIEQVTSLPAASEQPPQPEPGPGALPTDLDGDSAAALIEELSRGTARGPGETAFGLGDPGADPSIPLPDGLSAPGSAGAGSAPDSADPANVPAPAPGEPSSPTAPAPEVQPEPVPATVPPLPQPGVPEAPGVAPVTPPNSPQPVPQPAPAPVEEPVPAEVPAQPEPTPPAEPNPPQPQPSPGIPGMPPTEPPLPLPEPAPAEIPPLPVTPPPAEPAPSEPVPAEPAPAPLAEPQG